MRIEFRKVFLVGVELMVLAVICSLLYVLASAPSSAATDAGPGMLAALLGAATMVLAVLGSMVLLLTPFFAMVEILTGKNDNNYKVIWTAVLLFLSIVGFALYILIGRKRLK